MHISSLRALCLTDVIRNSNITKHSTDHREIRTIYICYRYSSEYERSRWQSMYCIPTHYVDTHWLLYLGERYLCNRDNSSQWRDMTTLDIQYRFCILTWHYLFSQRDIMKRDSTNYRVIEALLSLCERYYLVESYPWLRRYTAHIE